MDDAEVASAPGFADLVDEGADDVDEGGAGAVAEQGLLKQFGHGVGVEVKQGF